MEGDPTNHGGDQGKPSAFKQLSPSPTDLCKTEERHPRAMTTPPPPNYRKRTSEKQSTGSEDNDDSAVFATMTRSERKRHREKKRRSDVNKGFDELMALLLQIDPSVQAEAEDKARRGQMKGTVGLQDDNLLSRVDLIGRTVDVLRRIHHENEERKKIIEALMQSSPHLAHMAAQFGSISSAAFSPERNHGEARLSASNVSNSNPIYSQPVGATNRLYRETLTDRLRTSISDQYQNQFLDSAGIAPLFGSNANIQSGMLDHPGSSQPQLGPNSGHLPSYSADRAADISSLLASSLRQSNRASATIDARGTSAASENSDLSRQYMYLNRLSMQQDIQSQPTDRNLAILLQRHQEEAARRKRSGG